MTDRMTRRYDPAPDELALTYLIGECRTFDEKKRALEDAFWQIHNTGYRDAMAFRIASGTEDAQTVLFEKNCAHEGAICRLCAFFAAPCGEE